LGFGILARPLLKVNAFSIVLNMIESKRITAMKEEPESTNISKKTEQEDCQQSQVLPLGTPDGRAKAEMLRHYIDPLHPSDRNPLRRWFRMTGGRCSGGGGPC
jgi:hypothetical protein